MRQSGHTSVIRLLLSSLDPAIHNQLNDKPETLVEVLNDADFFKCLALIWKAVKKIKSPWIFTNSNCFILHQDLDPQEILPETINTLKSAFDVVTKLAGITQNPTKLDYMQKRERTNLRRATNLTGERSVSRKPSPRKTETSASDKRPYLRNSEAAERQKQLGSLKPIMPGAGMRACGSISSRMIYIGGDRGYTQSSNMMRKPLI